MFKIPTEIASENKLWRSIYIKDFIALVGTLFFAWITSSSIYQPLVIPYYIFLTTICLILISKSTTNPGKRVYQAIVILFIKNNYTYHSIDFEVYEEEN